MDVINPLGIDLKCMALACPCMCGGGANATAQQVGSNGGYCGCYCSLDNNQANFNGADAKA